MRIWNIRLGFATNSSSTHSIVFLPENERKDIRDGGLTNNDGLFFGWDNFTLRSVDAKRLYFAATLYHNVCKFLPPDLALRVTTSTIGIELPPSKYESYIDHQSVIDLPRTWDGRWIDMDFVRDLEKFLLQEGVLVLGGNDGGDDVHPLLERYPRSIIDLPLVCDEYHTDLVARKDPLGHWTVFNRDTGAKVRFSFPEGTNEVKEPARSSYPELVDIKLTNYCPHECSFCYQNSDRTASRSVSLTEVLDVIDVLESMRVFEVALGGGEITLIPNWVDILQMFREHGIVPNFSCRSLDWLTDQRIVNRVMEHVGAFAYSARTLYEATYFFNLVHAAGIEPHRAGMHIIPEIVGGGELQDMLTFASLVRMPVTLLGFKRRGRGIGYKTGESDWWKVIPKLYKQGNLPILSVDTCIAREYQTQLDELDISRHLRTEAEGAFSMYIDLPAKKMGPSSFEEESQMRPLDLKEGREKVVEQIAAFFREATNS